MNKPDEKYVYHGSCEPFDVAIPKRQKRAEVSKTGITKVIFDDISFHATPYEWIAIAYIEDENHFEVIDDKKVYYKKGVDLYKYTEEIEIYGFKSLEISLGKIYSVPGFLYSFDKDSFSHTQGIGNLEVIARQSIGPISIKRINNPRNELEKLGIKFRFIDLYKPENARFR
jgi:hypothetical protein